MKVVHLCTYDLRGGASRAAHRLHTGLRDIGVASQMLVQFRASGEPDVLLAHPDTRAARAGAQIRAVAERLPLHFYGRYDQVEFSPQWLPDRVPSRIRRLGADVIHLHWLSTGFVSIESIGKLDGPVVWTLHDMWPFTGGCHYSGECTAYSVACGACPELKSSHSVDLSRLVLLRKLAAWKRLNLTVVAPTAWLARRARASRLFGSRPVEVIPLGIDTSTYRPVPIPLARELLGLPQDAKVVLFGALGGDYRKGRDLLDAALARADQSRATGDLQLIVFGSAGTTRSSDASTTRTRYLGHLTDDLSLAVAYSAADVMVVPSREDNFPLTALEALACGTPVVGFDSTGLADMVDHCQTGYLARSFDPDDLWRGIQWVLEDDARRRALAQQARDKAVRDFAIEKVAMAYRNLYQRVTSASASRLAPAE